nr:type II toxin-antitoxin system YhaV family toxin [Azospirillum sp. SYSU D00513]
MYPAFRTSFDALTEEVERLAEADPTGYPNHPKSKLLKRISDLILEEIPADPGDKAYRQGVALGPRHKDWFRAKFLGRFRLFFRYNSKARIIIYCWVNDENSLRKAGSNTDPYTIFSGMVKSGRPPNDWNDLIKEVVG